MSTISLSLTPEEAEWLHACLSMVMQISRHWDNRTANDTANAVAAKLSLVIALDRAAPLEPLEEAS